MIQVHVLRQILYYLLTYVCYFGIIEIVDEATNRINRGKFLATELKKGNWSLNIQRSM